MRDVTPEPPERPERGPEAPTPPDTPAPEDDAFPDVLGWQPLILHRARPCASCAREIGRGEDAYAGVTGAGVGAVTLCERCMERLH